VEEKAERLSVKTLAGVNIAEGFGEVFEEVLGNCLGVSVKDAVIFHLTNKLSNDHFKYFGKNLQLSTTHLKQYSATAQNF